MTRGEQRNRFDKPNVLLICVDHWQGRLMGTRGHPAVLTPTLDRMAANGINFTNAYARDACVRAREVDKLPYALQSRRSWSGADSEVRVRMARRAFYALSTHIDHQLGAVIGTLRGLFCKERGSCEAR